MAASYLMNSAANGSAGVAASIPAAVERKDLASARLRRA
jgi:hypothetical protein